MKKLFVVALCLVSFSALAERKILGRTDLGNSKGLFQRHKPTVDVRECGITHIDFKVDQGDAAMVEKFKVEILDGDPVEFVLEDNEKLLEPEQYTRSFRLTSDNKGVCIEKIKIWGMSQGDWFSPQSEIEFRGHTVF